MIVITASDLTREDHGRLNGEVERILHKGTYGIDQLVAQVRKITSGREERVLMETTVES